MGAPSSVRRPTAFAGFTVFTDVYAATFDSEPSARADYFYALARFNTPPCCGCGCPSRSSATSLLGLLRDVIAFYVHDDVSYVKESLRWKRLGEEVGEVL